jgi:hypothetical protein
MHSIHAFFFLGFTFRPNAKQKLNFTTARGKTITEEHKAASEGTRQTCEETAHDTAILRINVGEKNRVKS